jgi:hypothetical protein
MSTKPLIQVRPMPLAIKTNALEKNYGELALFSGFFSKVLQTVLPVRKVLSGYSLCIKLQVL